MIGYSRQPKQAPGTPKQAPKHPKMSRYTSKGKARHKKDRKII